MLMQKLLFSCCTFLVFSARAFCQQAFTEGEIIYDVRITAADVKEAGVNTGTLTILIKGANVAKELNLQSGFRNTIVFNQQEKTAYSLRKVGNVPYAIQLDPGQLNRKQEKCARLEKQELESDRKTISGFAAEKVKLSCNEGNPVVVYYTKTWIIDNPHLFQDFPSFTYLPLSYEVKNEDGSILNFELKKIEAKPIDNRAFSVPPGYKKVSQQEYKNKL